MFLGKYFCGLDSEYRFLTPDGYRKDLIDDVYITQGFDSNLWVLTNDVFREIYKKLAQLNVTDPLARLLFRLLLGAATDVRLNDQGFLKIPGDLRKHAHIEKEVMLVGQGDYFEIWAPELWEKQEIELKDTESNIGRFSMFEITTR